MSDRHPTDAELADQGANHDASGAVAEHLSRCDTCRQRLSDTLRGGSPQTRPEPGRTDRPRAPTPSPALQPGERVGRYRILDTLGEGGMGVVHLAHDPRLDRRVALKLVRVDVKQGESADGAQARLLREAQAMARLSHPNVIAVYDVGTLRDRVFLAMELVVGSNARDWLAQRPRSVREILSVFRAAGEGLSAAHGVGLVHRDFKLDNVMVGKDGRVRIGDFGLARSAGASEPAGEPVAATASSAHGALSTPLTEAGAVVGTPAYMAPEQRLGGITDERTDLFSFCVSLYEALYGELPFEGRYDPRRPPAIRAAPPNSRVPAWLRRAVLAGLAHAPDDRPRDLRALLELLAQDPARRRRRTIAAVSGAVLLVAAMAIVWRVRARQNPCADPRGHIDTLWTSARMKALHDAFAASGEPSAQEALEHSGAAIQQKIDEWASAHQAICTATPRGVAPARGVRMGCLDRKRQALETLLDVLSHPSAAVVRHAVRAVQAIAPPRECLIARAPRSTSVPSASDAARLEDFRRRLEVARVYAAASDFDEAIPQLQALAEELAPLGDEPLEAEALSALGDAELARSPAGAEDALTRAVDAASASGMDALAARDAAELVLATGEKKEASAQASWEARTRSLLERLGGDDEVRATLEHSLGTLATGAGDARCGDLLVDALTLRERALGPEHPDTLLTRTGLAECEARRLHVGRAIDTMKEAIAITERSRGPDDYDLQFLLARLADWQTLHGDLSDARKTYDRIHHFEALYGDANLADALASESRLLLLEGQPEEAAMRAQRAVAVANAVTREGPRYQGDLVHLAATWVANGLTTEAIGLYGRVVPALEQSEGHDSVRLLEALIGEGEAYLTAGRAKDARPPLEQAVAIASRIRPPFGFGAEARFDLARALLEDGGDRRRASALLADAEVALKRAPYRKALLDQVAFAKSALAAARPRGKR